MYVPFQNKKVSYKKRQIKLSLQHSDKINMKAKQVTGKEGLGRRFPKVGQDMLFKEMGEDSLVVKALDSQSRGPVFKTTGWLQGQLSLSSFRGR